MRPAMEGKRNIVIVGMYLFCSLVHLPALCINSAQSAPHPDPGVVALDSDTFSPYGGVRYWLARLGTA